ncbi:MAG TPA: hypothetical protein VFI34_12595, partial [Candidatus Limnocylindrales bacterium]|nr:hypothetical protein [Candidatus Limnocylindrales bacterium]
MTAGGAVLGTRSDPKERPRPRAPRALVVLLAALGVAGAFGALAGSNPILGVASAGALLLAISIASRPDVAVYVVVGVIYSNAAVVLVQFHNVPAFAAIAVPGLLVVPVAYQLIVQKKPVVITSAFPAIVAFFLVQIIGTIFADDVDSAFDELVTFVVEGIGLYFLLVNTIRSVETMRWVVWILLAVGTFLGALSFYQ